jgi:hypothetical protein
MWSLELWVNLRSSRVEIQGFWETRLARREILGIETAVILYSGILTLWLLR